MTISELIRKCKKLVALIERVESEDYTPEKWVRNRLTQRGHYGKGE